MQISDSLKLINTFLGKVGMGAHSFDENNSMPLSFDKTLIGLHKDEQRNLITITSVIGKIPDDNETEINVSAYNKFLEENLATTIIGAGAVGISTEKRLLIYGNSVSLIDLTQDAFESFLERSVNTIEDWHEKAKKTSALIKAQFDGRNEAPESIIKA